jgi:hypothetical protein
MNAFNILPMATIARKNLRTFVFGTACLSAVLSLTSCASSRAQKELENVAKGWCQTIRASQVIPVYPLTEDLVVGDVFLVRRSIADQEKDYNCKGFLPLDDALVRLKYTDFSNIYFNGYWTNGFGFTPHPAPYYTNTAVYTNILTDAPIPRAAFPSYSFKAQSGFGLNLALPIEGIPVALSYLNSQQVDGSVTISDARTYAGDFGELFSLLRQWSNVNSNFLAETASNTYPKTVFLRVVSRVYYARAIDVALHRSGSQGASAKAGVVNDVSLMLTNAEAAQNYTNVLGMLSTMATTAANAAQAGGAVKFVSASESTVGLSQSFDRLLAIGYLGFDVPVNTNGAIGTPIPTFQHLHRTISSPRSGSFAPATAVLISPDLENRKIALQKSAGKFSADQAKTVLGQLGEPITTDPINDLRDRIRHSYTGSEIKTVEDAVLTVQH